METNLSKRAVSAGAASRQRGVATLIVVLVLFFVVSMVAAYTNRNLIFEQRTSANQYRSTQALEAAEAGLEWAAGTLNIGRVDDHCAPSTNVADPTFRQRLLDMDNTGRITPKPNPAGGELSALCVFTGTGWSCSCPSTGVAAVTAPTGNGSYPAFRVRFVRITPTAATARQPGVVKAEVVGCTRADSSTGDQCLRFTGGQGAAGEGRVVISSLLSISGNASSPPQAALVAREQIQVTGSGIYAYNTIAGGSGITIQSGGNINVPDWTRVVSQPGSPGGQMSAVANDANMSLPDITGTNATTTAERMFAAVFNLRSSVFRTQPATLEMTCGVAGCSAASLRTLVNGNPGRPIWLDGNLNIDTNGDIGSATDPVLLVVNGSLNFSVSNATIFGVVYIMTPAGSTEWTTNGGGKIVGAVVTDKEIRGNGTTSFVFDPDVVTRTRWGVGSFVRVPGSWRDFECAGC